MSEQGQTEIDQKPCDAGYEQCVEYRTRIAASLSREAALVEELDAAKKFIADVNNSIHGSQGYFLNGDTVAKIENLKALSNRNWQQKAALVEALKFYANPAEYTDAIPDFYSELDFAERAKTALAQSQERT